MTHEKQWKEVVKKNYKDIGYYAVRIGMYGATNLSLKGLGTGIDLFLHMALWKATFCKDYEPNWEDMHEPKYYFYFQGITKCYRITLAYNWKNNMLV